MRKISFVLIGGLMIQSALLFAQNTTRRINVVTTAVPMLRISPDARSGGMGDMGIATTPDANASFWNAAKIPFSSTKSAFGINYTPWLRALGLNDVYIVTAAGNYKFADNQAISASLRYFNLGTIQFTDFAGNELNQFRPREWALDAGYSRALSQKLGVGISLRYIFSNLASGNNAAGAQYKPGTAVSGDISMYYNGLSPEGRGITAGLVMSNLGSKINYTNAADGGDFIPANLGIGALYHSILDETSKISFGLDVNKLMVPTPDTTAQSLADYRRKSVVSSWFSSFGDAPGGFGEELEEFQISAGAEYAYDGMFFVRAGYFHEGRYKGNRRFFSAGVGINYNKLGFNFSYLIPSGQGINQNPLSNTTRFGIIFDLSNSRETVPSGSSN
ncbi:MAG: type IX secretion system outer membrane channel protein PorV [Bacteroidetes bacterium]|nr:type IX secretion system outer membrane channel protein PorV [Bacteroidota bacterium]